MNKAAEPVRYSVRQLADQLGLDWLGQGDKIIDGVTALTPGRASCLGFVESPAHRDQAQASQAGALIVPPELTDLPTPALLISEQPRLYFARASALFAASTHQAGIASSAVIADNAHIAETVSIGPHVLIEAQARIGERTQIGAGCVIQAGAVIGQDCIVGPNTVIYAGTVMGDRVRVGAGAVLGERGFGLVAGPVGMELMPQLGGVLIEDDVEIGANTTVDRGTIADTRVCTGVKLDNQVHIAHNCYVGSHTVIAGCTGIAGSTHIGAHCMIGGGVGIGDHVTIADEVVITAASQVPIDIDTKGVYSSTFRAMPAQSWRKRLALFRVLDRTEARLRRLERRLGLKE